MAVESKTPIRRVEDVKRAALALINSGVPDDDPRVNALRETYLRLTDPAEEGGMGLTPDHPLSWQEYVRHYEAANPGAQKTERTPEATQAVTDVGSRGFWESLPIAGGRLARSMQQGVQSLAGKAGRVEALKQSGMPVGLSEQQLADVAEGRSVEYAPASGLFGGKAMPGNPLEALTAPSFVPSPVKPAPSTTFTPTAQQKSVAKSLSTLESTLRSQRNAEAELYRAGIQDPHPVADIVGQGLASLAIPIPGAQIGTIAARGTAQVGGRAVGGLPAVAADIAARNIPAAAKRGVASAAVQAPVNAAIAGMEYSPEGQNAQNATIAALMTGTLGVASPVSRTLLYRLRNGDRLTQRELDILAANASPQPAPQVGAALPDEQVEAARGMGVEIQAPDTTGQALSETVNRNLTPEEIAALPPAAQQNLAIFRQFGYEPTPAEVLRDYTTMDELRSVAQVGSGESADAVRARLAQAKEAPKRFLESKVSPGADVTQTGPLAEGVLKGVRETAQDRIGRAYDEAAEQAEAAGVKVYADKMVDTAADNFTDFAVGNAATSSALYHKFALQVAKSLDPEVVKKIDAEIAETAMHPQEVGPTKFMKYVEAARGVSPTTLEFMRKELNRAKPSTPSDAEIISRIKTAIRQDTEALPEDYYGRARAMAAENFDVLRRVPEIGKFVKEGIPYERAHDLLWKMPQKKWDITEEWIKRHGNKDQRESWAAVKSLMKDRIYRDILDATQSTTLNVNGEREVMSAAFDRALRRYTSGSGYGRLESLIGKKGVEELTQLNRYLQLLEVPRTGRSQANPSGSALKILDSWATSGSQTKRAIGNAIKFAISASTAPARESPQQMADRLRRTQIETSAAESSAEALRKAAEAKLRQDAMRGLSVKGDVLQNIFTTGAARQYGQ